MTTTAKSTRRQAPQRPKLQLESESDEANNTAPSSDSEEAPVDSGGESSDASLPTAANLREEVS